ncbi:SNF2 domain-containing protein CLASSY 4-like [Abeliophyllum distichum]|uniref:SNF2 domain-containing protein CLASSY 4-like n=1 Tax=Abeliophyllum distichum TaxID=126358 RepID=A0ABD1PB63_9LAMI
MGENVGSTGSCSKSGFGLIPSEGCVACKNCGFHNVAEVVVADKKTSGVRGRGRPRKEPLNKGKDVPFDASVDLGKPALFVDSEDSEESIDSEGSYDDYSDEDYEASSEEDEDDSDEVYEANSDVSKYCREETDDDTYFDNYVGGPMKTKVHSDSLSSDVNQQTEDDTFFGNYVGSAGKEENEQPLVDHSLSSSDSYSLRSSDSYSLSSDINQERDDSIYFDNYVGSAGQHSLSSHSSDEYCNNYGDSPIKTKVGDSPIKTKVDQQEKEQSAVDPLSSGDCDVSIYCSDVEQEKDDDQNCDNHGGCPIKMKVDQEEKEQTVVVDHEQEGVAAEKEITNEDSELVGSKRKYEPCLNDGYVDDSHEDGDGTHTVKSSKEENDEFIAGGLKKRKFSGLQILVDCNKKRVKEQKSMAKRLRSRSITRHQKKNLELGKYRSPLAISEGEESNFSPDKESKSSTKKDSCNRKCVQRTGEKGTREVGTSGKEKTSAARNPNSINMPLDSIVKEADEHTPHKKKTGTERNLDLKMSVDSIEKEASEPTPGKKRTGAAINLGSNKISVDSIEKEADEPTPSKKKTGAARYLDSNQISGDPIRKEADEATPGKKKTGAARNLDSNKISVDPIEKEADEPTPCKKKTDAARNLDSNKISVDAIEKEADEPIPSKKKTNAAIKMLVDFIEKEADGPRESLAPVDSKPNSLPLKFRFEDEDPSPLKKSEWEKEIDSLFGDLVMGLRESESGCTNPSTVGDDEDDDFVPQDIDNTPAACCRRGEHDPILDEQIGIKCKYCSAVLLEIEDILPPFYTPPSGKRDKKDFGESHSRIFDQIQFQDATGNPSSSSIHAGETVWDLIHDSKSKLYPHQREGFEFMWKNIAGDIFIEKLKRPLSDDGNGCIISHAPGTGKTRLTIVFLQAFMNQYPMCRPVIIAPRGMLLTWEDEFRKWKVDIPFHNLNKLELSAEENAISAKIIGQVGCRGRSRVYIRFVKVTSWLTSSSILGVSYPLFEKLAGDRQQKGQHDQIRKYLLNSPGLLVLDEGHTPRSDQSLTWKALTSVATSRRIMLSGTPFQNNFEELCNTLCLVHPKFADQIDEIHPRSKRGRAKDK